MSGQVIPFPHTVPPVDPPTAAEMESKVHRLAQNTANLMFDHPHFQKRLVQRKLTMRQVLETLRQGGIVGIPVKDQWGDWRVKLRRKVAGRRVQVVVAVKEKRNSTLLDFTRVSNSSRLGASEECAHEHYRGFPVLPDAGAGY